jgi:glycosyltransferase involved in cell wall biosynthesis
VSHAVERRPTPSSFDHRRSILFVGAFSSHSSNEDAVSFFCRDVLPELRKTNACNAAFVVAGANIPDRLRAFGDSTISWHPDVDDLTPLYDDARVFVAPTRYSAGIALKVIEAAARGVPIVCTPLVAQQLGWVPGKELLAADTAAEFARAVSSLYSDPELWRLLREAALNRVARDYSATEFRSALEKALRKCLADGPENDRGLPRLSRSVAAGNDSSQPGQVPPEQ